MTISSRLRNIGLNICGPQGQASVPEGCQVARIWPLVLVSSRRQNLLIGQTCRLNRPAQKRKELTIARTLSVILHLRGCGVGMNFQILRIEVVKLLVATIMYINKTALLLVSTLAIAACSDSGNDEPQTDSGVSPAEDDNSGTDTGSVGASSGIINQENYQAMLTLLLPVVDGTRLSEAADVLTTAVSTIGTDDSTIDITQTDSNFDQETFTSTSNYICNTGGVLTYLAATFYSSYTFDQCTLAGNTYSGFMSTNYQRDQSDTIFEELAIVSSSATVFLNGALHNTYSTSAFYEQSRNIAFSRAQLSGEDDLLITDYDLSMASSNNSGQSAIERTLTSTLTVNASWGGDEQHSVQVRTTQPFQGEQPDDFYTNGIMTVTASDGSTLTMNADNGDPATVQVTINAAGVVSSDLLNWSDTLQLRCLDDTSNSGEYQYACGS